MLRTKFCVLMICLLSTLLAACGAGQTPATIPPMPTVTPEVAIPATAVAPRGPMIAGRVLWGTMPVARARVELRTGAWADPSASQTIAKVTADDTGSYQLEAPPAGGEFGLVALWPDDSHNTAPVIPVQVSAGTMVSGVDVYLAKKLALLEPASKAVVGPMPTLKWEGLPNATQYRVWVIDAGTTEAVIDQLVTDARLTVGTPLKTGDYRWVVNGLTADNHLLASFTDEFKVTATVAGTDPCQVEKMAIYISQTDGYCFAYPPNFTLQMSKIGQPVVSGPALDQSPDPLRATLTLEVEVAARDRGLTQIVDGYVSQFDGLNVPPIKRTSFTLGGEAAEMLEGVPGRGGSRDVFALRKGTLFHLMFMPSVSDFPLAHADVEALYQAVIGSWSFESLN